MRGAGNEPAGAIERLAHELGKLPGIGPKSAERLTHFLLGAARDRVRALAADPTPGRDGSALCRSGLLGPAGVKVTRMARGVPSGSVLEFGNTQMLADALEGRRSF